MLNILILILKILGFLILGVIGLILLLVLILLFSSFSYKSEFMTEGTAENTSVKVSFHWIFRLIGGEFRYDCGKSKWRFRIAWKNYTDEDEPSEDSGTFNVKKVRKSEKKKDPEKKKDSEKRKDVMKSESSEEAKSESQIRIQRSESQDDNKKTADLHHGPTPAQNKGTPQEKVSRFKKLTGKIKYTIKKLCDNIKELIRKKEKLQAFIGSEPHRKALSFTLRETRRLLGWICPKKGNLNLEFGFSNPAYTGYALAGISMVWPLAGEYIDVRPDFENKKLKADGMMKGNIRLVYIAVYLWKMYWNKNVKTTYRHIKNFKW